MRGCIRKVAEIQPGYPKIVVTISAGYENRHQWDGGGQQGMNGMR